jgi:hypothetical protein
MVACTCGAPVLLDLLERFQFPRGGAGAPGLDCHACPSARPYMYKENVCLSTLTSSCVACTVRLYSAHTPGHACMMYTRRQQQIAR